MRPPGEVLYTMENHSTALRAWAQHEVRSARCVHLDAHLDVGWSSPGNDDLDLADLRERDCFLHSREGHFDIASWLGVALARGMVSELFWVVPDEVWFAGPGQLQDLLARQVGSLRVEDFTALSDQRGPYRFTLADTEVTVCRLGELPALGSEPTLLDIDLDFFARYRTPGPGGDWSTPWAEPDQVISRLHAQVPGASITTMSVSWHGGYLPAALAEQLAFIHDEAEPVEGGDVWHRRLSDRTRGPYASYTHACGLLHRKRPAEALPLARLAAEEDPGVGAYHYAVALGEAAVGGTKRAAQAMRQCLDSGNVESAQVLNDAAGLWVREGLVGDALAMQQAAFDLDESDSPIVCGNLMALHAQAGDWDQARELATRTLLLQPFNVEAMVTLAVALQHHGHRSSAAEAWERAARATPDEGAAAAYRRRAARLAGKGRLVTRA